MFCRFLTVGTIVFSIASSMLAHSDDNQQETFEPIIVNGSRLEQFLIETGSSISVISAQDIEALGFNFALDALASAPGVTINSNGTFGGVGSVRIRGAASAQTLVLIDGVPVSDPSAPGGGFDFSRLDTDSIERIEVLKGPHSTLWGSDAMGGVVSITTKEADDGFGGNIFGEYGSFNTFRAGGAIYHANDRGDFRLGLVKTKSDGISKADEDNGNSEKDPYEALNLSAKGGVSFGKNARLSADIRFTDAKTDFDSFAFGQQGNIGDGDELSETQSLSAHISLTGSLFNEQLDNLLQMGYFDIKRDNFSNGIPNFDAQGERQIIRYQGTLDINDRNKLAFGAESEILSVNGDDSILNGLFALYEFKPSEQLTFTGGVRMDDHEDFGSETTARLAAAYNPNAQLTFRTSWGQGFKAPTIFQMTYFCCGASTPNPDLKAETSKGFDAGLDWRARNGRTKAGITYFNQDSENQIDFSFARGGYENIAKVKSQGVELYSEYQLTRSLKISANYTYLDTKDGANNRLARLPEHSGDMAVHINPEGPFSGSVLIRYNGEEANTDGTKLKGWTRLDVNASYELNDKVEIFGRIENLFNEEYQQVLGYGTPDLSAYIGIRLKY